MEQRRYLLSNLDIHANPGIYILTDEILANASGKGVMRLYLSLGIPRVHML